MQTFENSSELISKQQVLKLNEILMIKEQDNRNLELLWLKKQNWDPHAKDRKCPAVTEEL